MQTAKLFPNGQSQAVRLPKEYRFEGDRVYIQRVGKQWCYCRIIAGGKCCLTAWGSSAQILRPTVQAMLQAREQHNGAPLPA